MLYNFLLKKIQLSLNFLIIYKYFIILAGFPATTTLSGTSLTTTEPAATTTLFPIVAPGNITELPPIHALFPITTGFPYKYYIHNHNEN